jgi:hypothetical protein
MDNPQQPWQSWRTACEALPEALTLAGAAHSRLPSGRVGSIPRATGHFSPWRGAITIDTWGGKPVLDVQGDQTFAEVALVRMFQASRWEARWLETYNAPPQWPLVLDRWSPAGIKAREIVPIGNARVAKVLQYVIAHNGGRCRGCWDVLAWHGSALLWAEAKRARYDRLSDTQKHWLAAALQAGLAVESFLLVEWQS